MASLRVWFREFAFMAELDCIVAGEANVDLLMDGIAQLEFDKEKLVKDCGLTLGGSSAITAFNLSKLGARVGFAGVVGKDLFGRFVEERMTSARIDLTALRRDRALKTGITIWCQNGKRRAGVTYLGTIAALRASDVKTAHLRRARHLHVGAYFLLKDFHAGAAEVFRKAKRMSMSTSLDCNFDPEEKWDSGIREVLKNVDIFLPNETEARRLTGVLSTRDAAAELAQLAGAVVVKMGARGALVVSKSGIVRVPPVKARVVDATGAGDSFNAGFLASFLRGQSLQDCAKAGAIAGARSVAHIGGTAAFE
jgi:sugar/nucleoside kinase (ribokinase family)